MKPETTHHELIEAVKNFMIMQQRFADDGQAANFKTYSASQIRLAKALVASERELA